MPAEVVTLSGPGAVAKSAQATTPAAAPATPAAPAPSAPAKSPEVAALEAKIAESERRARIMLQRQSDKLTGEAKKEREGLGAKLGRLTELEKREQRAKLDPSGYLADVYGKDWYDIVINAKINNGAPTSDAVALKLAEMEEKFESKLKERDEQQTKAQQEAQAASVEESRREQKQMASEFWATAGKDFPLVDGLGTPEQVAGEIARRREAHYNATMKQDENGRLVAHGQILPLQKVAELWEAELVKLAERAAGHEKYAGKFAPKVAAPKDVGQPQRRTLSNDLTGSTPARSAPANDIERRERANAAYEARSKRPL